MALTGGDIVEVSYNHPTLGSGTLFPKAGESSTFDLGGIRSNDDAQGIDGGGNMIAQMSRTRWRAEIVPAWDMSTAGFENVVALAGSPVDADWTITHINGTVYQGKGRPVGDLQGAGLEATFALILAGGGPLKKVV